MLMHWHGETNWIEALYVTLPGVGMGMLQCTTFVHLAACADKSESALVSTMWFLARMSASWWEQVCLCHLSTSWSQRSSNKEWGNRMIKQRFEKSRFAPKIRIFMFAQIIRRIMSDIQAIRRLPATIVAVASKAYVDVLLASNGQLDFLESKLE